MSRGNIQQKFIAVILVLLTAYLLQRYPRLRLPNREFVFGTNPQALSQILGDNHTSTPVNANVLTLLALPAPRPPLMAGTFPSTSYRRGSQRS